MFTFSLILFNFYMVGIGMLELFLIFWYFNTIKLSLLRLLLIEFKIKKLIFGFIQRILIILKFKHLHLSTWGSVFHLIYQIFILHWSKATFVSIAMIRFIHGWKCLEWRSWIVRLSDFSTYWPFMIVFPFVNLGRSIIVLVLLALISMLLWFWIWVLIFSFVE